MAVQRATDAYVDQHLRALRRETGSTPFLDGLDAADYDTRVRVWADQFARPESWVRRYTSTSDSAELANIRLVNQFLLEERGATTQ